MLDSGVASGPGAIDDEMSEAAPNSVNPTPRAAGRHQSVRSCLPSTMPVQRKASHGSSGWVPLIATSVSRSRTLDDGAKNQLVSSPSSDDWTCHQCNPAAASAAARPTASTHVERNVNSAAATTNIAP